VHGGPCNITGSQQRLKISHPYLACTDNGVDQDSSKIDESTSAPTMASSIRTAFPICSPIVQSKVWPRFGRRYNTFGHEQWVRNSSLLNTSVAFLTSFFLRARHYLACSHNHRLSPPTSTLYIRLDVDFSEMRTLILLSIIIEPN
jgi:hypothetical protein